MLGITVDDRGGPCNKLCMANVAKLLTETLRMADGGKVECEVMTPDGGRVTSIIEQSFFEDFMGVPSPRLSAQQQNRIINDNVSYLEAEAERQWRMGSREVVIR